MSKKELEMYLENWYEQIHATILKSDLESYEELLKDRKDKIDNYQGEGKKEILLMVLSKDEKIKELIAEKAEVIKKMIIAGDRQQEAISAYKLYE